MNGLETIQCQCPYCWEVIDICIDCSVPTQEYVEDCEVCCQPIVIQAELTAEGHPKVAVQREN